MPRTPPWNGIAKRRNTSIIDYARTLMMEKNVPQKYWREAIFNVIYILNIIKVKKEKNDVECKKEPKYYNTFIYVNDVLQPLLMKKKTKS